LNGVGMGEAELQAPSAEMIAVHTLVQAWVAAAPEKQRARFLRNLAELIETELSPERVAHIGDRTGPDAGRRRATARAWLQRGLVSLMSRA
jgi:hypothetical protein